jgi:hypothetical protein
MYDMEATSIFDVKVNMFTLFEGSKMCLLPTVNKSGIVTLTVQHEMIGTVIAM